MARPRGLDRLRAKYEARLDEVAAALPLRRLTDAERDEIEAEAVAAIREARTARALGRGLMRVVKAALKLYLGGA
jgi:hypothetical protein